MVAYNILSHKAISWRFYSNLCIMLSDKYLMPRKMSTNTFVTVLHIDIMNIIIITIHVKAIGLPTASVMSLQRNNIIILTHTCDAMIDMSWATLLFPVHIVVGKSAFSDGPTYRELTHGTSVNHRVSHQLSRSYFEKTKLNCI